MTDELLCYCKFSDSKNKIAKLWSLHKDRRHFKRLIKKEMSL